MKILLIGASGTIGSAIEKELAPRHEVIRIGRTGADEHVDISDSDSIRKLFERTGPFDALICAAGNVTFAPLGEMTADSFALGLRDKLMGQVNLLLIGREFANDGASFTFTTGITSVDPIRTGASASLVNGAIDAFVRAAAIEMPRGMRVNSVSPNVWSKPWATTRRTFVASSRFLQRLSHWRTQKVSKGYKPDRRITSANRPL
jgi:NAD(P)-dependent dehydrogenase (short-subunit alcohol dehydrogenase family)